MTLNPDQQIVYDSLRKLILEKGAYDFARLRGFAGTGKSFVLSRVIESLPFNYRTGMTAPTHKAVRVLKRISKTPELYEYGTIHSFLGLKQVIKHNGEVTYENENFNPKGLKIDRLHILVIDESSMLSRKVLKSILDYKKKNEHLKLIFTGDPLQIPPVGEKETLVFSDEAEKHYKVMGLELNIPMRQAKGNPILDFATEIRSNILTYVPVPEKIETRKESDIPSLVEELFNTREFKKDADYCKILAWTNATVNRLNTLVRKKILDNPVESIVAGEKLIADKPIVSKITQQIQFNTSEEMTVKTVEMGSKTLSISFYHLVDGDLETHEEELQFNTYNCTVISDDRTQGGDSFEEPTPMEFDIVVLHPSSQQKFSATLSRLETLAKKARHKKAWMTYYGFLNYFAQVKYNYALTCHKSQGSSYQNCILIDNDILINPDPWERNRIRYVAASRARQRLIIIK